MKCLCLFLIIFNSRTVLSSELLQKKVRILSFKKSLNKAEYSVLMPEHAATYKAQATLLPCLSRSIEKKEIVKVSFDPTSRMILKCE